MKESMKEKIIMSIQWGLWILFPLSLLIQQIKYTFLRPYGYSFLISGVILFVLANKVHGSTNKLKLTASSKPNNSAKLVTSGIYSYIRHPIYSSFILISIGTAFLIGTLGSLVVAIASLIFYYSKSIYEEELLIHVYPNYNMYKEKTGRFIPKKLN
jgi:protein-S-isoprenylcysteine O-methyltransferase Ste14